MFVVYQNPKDYPGKFVVRIHKAEVTGSEPGDLVAVEESLDKARQKIPPYLACFARHPSDDPVIVETWL